MLKEDLMAERPLQDPTMVSEETETMEDSETAAERITTSAPAAADLEVLNRTTPQEIRIIAEDSETTHRVIPIIIPTTASGITRLTAIPTAEDSETILGLQHSRVRLSRTPTGIRTAVVLDKTIINKKTDS